MAKETVEILAFINMARDYEAEMILDELTLYLKELLLGRNGKISPMIIERFFRVIAESKALLSLGSDSEFVLSLALFKMIESLEIKDIDTMIRGLEKELEGVEVSEIMVSSPVADVSAPPEVITITEDEIVATIPETTPKPVSKKDSEPSPNEEKNDTVPETVKEHSDEPIASKIEEVKKEEIVSSSPQVNPHKKIFDNLVKKIYDRNYDLGACFERNIAFESFQENKLTWVSQAEGGDKKSLITHWGVINMFVKECFSLETKIINIPKKKVVNTSPSTSSGTKNNTVAELVEVPHNDADVSSMIEEIEMKSSCISPEAGDTEAAKEKDPSTLLQEPMVKEAIALFDPKKVRIKRNT